MGNITDYLKWRGDILLTTSRFNEVDNLILAEFSYFNYEHFFTQSKMTIKDLISNYLVKNDEKSIEKEMPLSRNPIPFLKELVASKRFGSLKVFNYVNIVSKKEEKQFSAISIELNYNTVYISFKGTDNTLLGWREDFDLSFKSEIPSQLEAMRYVNKTPRKYKHIILGGHSKGGNLAVYAAAHADKKIKKRIKRIYNNDGPGFLEEFIQSDAYKSIETKIQTIVPETSIIGMLLTRKGEYSVVKSEGSGIWQHDALAWQVENTHFITLNAVDETSTKIQETMQNWITNISREERERFVNTLFSIFDECHIETVESLSKLSLRKISNILKTYNNLDAESKNLLTEVIKSLVKEARKNFDSKDIIHGLKSIQKKY